MITKYMSVKGSTYKIIKVEVEKQTALSVWVDGKRVSRLGNMYGYHNTWEDAHEYLFKCAHGEVGRARRRLEVLKSILGNVKGMKNPEATND